MPVKQPEGAENAGPLAAHEVRDDADQAARAPQDLSGKRVRAIPYMNGTTIKVSEADFRSKGIEHPDIEFDYRIDQFTLPVGPKLSSEAAEMLTSKFPETFEYMSS